MRFEIHAERPILTVFQYEFEGRLVFIGWDELTNVSFFGKNCKILDIEFQRRVGTSDEDRFFGDPTVTCTILWQGHDPVEAEKQAIMFRKTFKTCWNVEYDAAFDRRHNPHILHVERKTVFASISSAAAALGISHPNAASMLNRTMFAGQRPGPVAKNHLVTTSRPVDHDLRYMREQDLRYWRQEHGYEIRNKRTHDMKTGERINTRR